MAHSPKSLSEFPAAVLVGAGKMGGAMLEGWLARGLDPKSIAVIEPQPGKAVKALARRGLKLNPKGARRPTAGVIVIAVKPQSAPEAVPPLGAYVGKNDAGALDHGRPHDRLSGKRAAARHRDRARDAEHAGRDRPRHHGRGRQRAKSPRASASSRPICSLRSARSNGSTTKA